MSKFNKRRPAAFTKAQAERIDYKDPRFLEAFITETKQIMPARLSGAPAKAQRALSTAIKRARFLALLPYTDNHKR